MEQKQKILHLTLSKKWFDLIAYGDKREEYREIKPYWINRFVIYDYRRYSTQLDIKDLTTLYKGEHLFNSVSNDFDLVSANNGYQRNCPNVTWKHKGIRIGTGREDWGAEPGKQYFILEIGEIVSNSPF
jgi:hypothetical protein